MNGLARIAVVVGTAALLTACGSDKKAATTTTSTSAGDVAGAASTNATVPLPKPACELLSQDDVAKALGNAVKPAVPAEASNCTWGTNVDGGSSLDLTVVKPSAQGATQACADQRKTLPRGVAKDQVSGVGDSAVWVFEELTTIKQGHLLACWKDGVVVVLITGEHDGAALQTTAKAVAEEVHHRI